MCNSCVSHMVVVSVTCVPFLCAAMKRTHEQSKTGQSACQRSPTLFSTLTSEWPRADMPCSGPGSRDCLALEIRKEMPLLILFSHPQVQRLVRSKQRTLQMK